MKPKTSLGWIGICIFATIFIVLFNVTIAPAQPGKEKEKSDGQWFKADKDDIVVDKKSGLMWAAYDNGSDINWADAKKYCERYRGGGYSDWRLPKQDELAQLYDSKKSYQSKCGSIVHTTKLIEISCSSLWASETNGNDAAFFQFTNGYRGWYPQSNEFYGRVLPVRTVK